MQIILLLFQFHMDYINLSDGVQCKFYSFSVSTSDKLFFQGESAFVKSHK